VGTDTVVFSRNKKRVIIGVGVALVIGITVLGVRQVLPSDETAEPAAADAPSRPPSALEVTGRFLDAFTSGDTTSAGALTDDAPNATAQLGAVWVSLRPTALVADRGALVAPPTDATTADERFTLTWELGPGRTWTYESALRLVKKDADWLVQWQPALVHPQLPAGHNLALRDRTGQPAVLDRDGAPLLTWTDDATTAVDPVSAPLLRPGMSRVAGGPDAVNGWHIAVVDGAGTDTAVIHGSRAAALTSTLSRQVQHAAQAAVDTQQLPAMVVALQPSTGDLLAVAQNSEAGNEPTALNGLYPPGSTFKIATATAIVEGGVADVGTVVPCPGAVTVGQRTVRNADFELGDVPLRTAFAQSCNTTFAMQAANLPLDALSGAADQLGLGADFDIPGITTEAGSVHPATTMTEQVENSIGQGTVQTSCFGLALVSATVAAGRAVIPRLWRDLATTVTTGYQAPPAGVIGSLRTMMRAVVTSGRATALASHGNVFGKTGTAEIDDGGAHGWFTGYRDDVAFATLVLNGDSSTTAVTVTDTFLRALA
jgi:beta-lactamase class D